MARVPSFRERAAAAYAEWCAFFKGRGGAPTPVHTIYNNSGKKRKAKEGNSSYTDPDGTGASSTEVGGGSPITRGGTPKRPRFDCVSKKRSPEVFVSDRVGSKQVGALCLSQEVVGGTTKATPLFNISYREAAQCSGDLGAIATPGRLVPQDNSQRVRNRMPRLPRADSGTSTVGGVVRQRQSVVRIARRIRSRSFETDNPHNASRFIRRGRAQSRQGSVFRQGQPDNSERQETCDLGYVATEQVRECVALQGVSGQRRTATDATRRLSFRDRPEAILSLPRIGGNFKRQSFDLGRAERVDSTGVRLRPPNNSSGADGSVWAARRASSNGKTPPSGRSDDPRTRSSFSASNGRPVSHEADNDGTREGNKVDDRVADKPRFPYFVEEITDASGEFYRVLRNSLELDTERSLHPSLQEDSHIAVIQAIGSPEFGNGFAGCKRSWQNTERKDGAISGVVMAQGKPELGDPDLSTSGLVRAQADFTGGKDRAKPMERPSVATQWLEYQTPEDLDATGGRRGGVRDWRDALRHARGDLRGMAEWQGSVVKRARATGRHSHGNVLYSPARPQEHYPGSSIGQYDEHILPQQTRGPDPVVRSTDARLSGVVFPRAEYHNPCVSLPGNRHNRVGGGRIFAGDQPTVPAAPALTCMVTQPSKRHVRRGASVVQRDFDMVGSSDTSERKRRDISDSFMASGPVVAAGSVNDGRVASVDPEERLESGSRGRREGEVQEICAAPRLNSLANLRSATRCSNWSNEDFKTQFSGARSRKADRKYDIPWTRWIQFSSVYEQEDVRNHEWNLSIHKHAKFLAAIWDGFGGVKTSHSKSVYKLHSSAVLTTFEVGSMVRPELKSVIAQVKSSNAARNFLNSKLRSQAECGNPRRGAKIAQNSDLWDPVAIFEFWHHFPSLKSMLEATWPLKLVRLIIRAKAVSILRLEGASRSSDASHLSWSDVSTRFDDVGFDQIPVSTTLRYSNTKGMQLQKKFGAKSKPITLFKTENSNSCVLLALKELWSQRSPRQEDQSIDNPVFVGLTRSRDATGELKFRKLTAQRLSKVFRVSLIGAGLGHAQPREARHMASTKASVQGLPDTVICNYGLWDSIETFKKHYLRKMSVTPPTVSDPSFSEAVRVGMKRLSGSAKALRLQHNIKRLLSLSQYEVNCCAKSSKSKTLQKLYKISNAQILRAIKAEMCDVPFSLREGTRRSSGTQGDE